MLHYWIWHVFQAFGISLYSNALGEVVTVGQSSSLNVFHASSVLAGLGFRREGAV